MKKTLLVTGASSEVGTKLVESIYGDYDRIYLHYAHMNERLSELADRIGRDRAYGICADLSDPASTEELIERIKAEGDCPSHIVHLPAPKAYNKQFHKYDPEQFDKGFTVCVRSAVSILQAFIPAMAKQHYGRIVFMLTSGTIDMPAKYQSGYITVKYALLGLMKALSAEYADKGITVNGVSPDMMETRFLSDLPELIVETNAANSPLGRNVRIEEIIPVIRYMLSEEGAAMTGQNIGITGGL